MGIGELLIELKNLNRADKLRALQVLVMDLAAEEDAMLVSNKTYEVWSPYDAPQAAQTLLNMLDEDKKSENG